MVGSGEAVRTGRNLLTELEERGMDETNAQICCSILVGINNYGGEISLEVAKKDLYERRHDCPSDLDFLCYMRSLETFGFVKYIPEKMKYALTKKGEIN